MEALFTLREWKQLPEGFPAQLIDGCLIRDAAPDFDHQDVVGEIYFRLRHLVDRRRVVLSPTDVVIDRLNVLQPDVCLLREPLRKGRHDVGIPLLAFEVLSPGARKRDLGVKTVKLLAAGVEELWLVDHLARSITVRTTEGARVFGEADVACSEALPEVRLVLRELFGD